MSIKILAESRSGCGQVHGGKSFEAEFCKEGATHFYSFSLFFFFFWSMRRSARFSPCLKTMPPLAGSHHQCLLVTCRKNQGSSKGGNCVL